MSILTKNRVGLLLLLTLFVAHTAAAQVPQKINFQGCFENSTQLPASVPVRFDVYASATGGQSLWSSTTTVTHQDCFFSVILGEVDQIPPSLFTSNSALFLGLTVNSVLQPTRFPFNSAPYALRTASADAVAAGAAVTSVTVGGTRLTDNIVLAAGTNVTLTPSGQTLTINAGNTGVGPNTVGTSQLIDSSVAGVDIADNAINSIKIQDGTVSAADLASSAAVKSVSVGSTKLTSDVVLAAGTNVTISPSGQTLTIAATAGAPGDNSVGSAQIVDGAVATADIANNAITGSKILDGTITGSDMASSTITSTQLATGAVASSDILDGTIASIDIFDGTIGSSDIGASAVGNDELTDNPDMRTIDIFNNEGVIKTNLGILTDKASFIRTYQGANDNFAVWVATSSTDGAGLLNVYNAAGTNIIQLSGSSGNVFGTSFISTGAKNFRTDHPEDPTKEIYYAAIEGPEVGVYIRGTAELIGGESIITLPDHFRFVTAEEGITVQVTPLSAASEGLAVTSKSTSQITVRELRNGTGSYSFDYVVSGVRLGFENYEVIRDKVGMEQVNEELAAPDEEILENNN